MRRAVAHRPAGAWPADAAAAAVTLPYAERHRRRIRLIDDAGVPFRLDLPRPVPLGDGDGLELAGGGWLRVVAAEEEVAEARCDNPAHLARLAWHVGNRHAPVQVVDGATLRLLDDPVLVAMLEGLGAVVTHRRAPFAPEGGAYGGEGGHGHGPSHGG